MTTTSDFSDLIDFAPERQAAPQSAPWKLLIVDDEPDVHEITELTLRGATFHGRPLRFLHAYSGRDAVELLRREEDIALVLMDVVMETEHAGLEAVQAIRNDLRNQRTRIVLRTGHPGQAPEHEVVRSYDINDYKEKTELTSKKMYTLVHTSLGHYRELKALEDSRTGLETVIRASASIFEMQSLQQFARGVLQQLSAVLYAQSNSLFVHAEGLAASCSSDGGPRVIAATGKFAGAEGQDIVNIPDAGVRQLVQEALARHSSTISERSFAGYFSGASGAEHVVVLTSDSPFSVWDQRLVTLFCRNVAIAFENLTLQEQMVESQRQIIMLLTEAIEERSRETGNHVRRVVGYTAALGRLAGLPEKELEVLPLASAMHDVGKIGIPDAILHKPGPLDVAERGIMESHAQRGQELLQGQKGEVMQAAAIIAGQHHERWDGKGYPGQRKETETHLYARIACLADVFDALTTGRCYKEPWPLERALHYIREQRGGQFDPALVDLLLDNIEIFDEIRRRYPDLPTLH
jgi:response regulator RpfG family c-di-GMP phosphodiesterase